MRMGERLRLSSLSSGRRLVVRYLILLRHLLTMGRRSVYEKQHPKMEVLPPVVNVKSLHETTKRIRSEIVTVSAIVNVSATRTATEAKTMRKSREARSIITAAVGMMPSMRRGTGIVLRIG